MAGSFENVTWNGIYKYLYHIIILKGSTCGLITEQNPKSVPKNGRKLVVFWGNLSEPNLKLTFGFEIKLICSFNVKMRNHLKLDFYVDLILFYIHSKEIYSYR